MDGTGIGRLCQERGWSRTRLVHELRRAAMAHGEHLPTDESLKRMLRQWISGERDVSTDYATLLRDVFGVAFACGGAHQDRAVGRRDVTGTTGWFADSGSTSPVRIALCGSRAPDTDEAAFDQAVIGISRVLLRHACVVDHGPLGIGIEVLTYIADHYRPSTLLTAVGVFGHQNVVRRADLVVVVGGGAGTQLEVDIALAMRKRVVPLAGSGGVAARTNERLVDSAELRSWLAADVFDSLGQAIDADSIAFTLGGILAAGHRTAVA